nr:D-alanine--D-alanine ligase [uncultured bacterium]
MKKRVGIIFGGRSAEHEVSLQLAMSIIANIDNEKYEVVPIGITKTGQWALVPGPQNLIDTEQPKPLEVNDDNDKPGVLVRGQAATLTEAVDPLKVLSSVDVVFPVLHGPYGEDGTIQGMLKVANIPFVGPSVLGSAVAMDKDVMKRLFKASGVPTPKLLVFHKADEDSIQFSKISAELGTLVFVKPANLGSSVGVSKVTNEEQLKRAVDEAFKYDTKILIEEGIDGREIECSVLGNENPIASVPGEIVVHADFYSYDAKYLNETSSSLIIPAELSPELTKKVQDLSIAAFEALCCEGMARVDFFLRGKELLVNEVNTIPGFTKISMYPKLWEASGMPYSELIDRLIELAIARFEQDIFKV